MINIVSNIKQNDTENLVQRYKKNEASFQNSLFTRLPQQETIHKSAIMNFNSIGLRTPSTLPCFIRG